MWLFLKTWRQLHFSNGRIIVQTYCVFRPEISFQFGKCKYYLHQCESQSFNLSLSLESSSLFAKARTYPQWYDNVSIFLSFFFCFFLPLSPFYHHHYLHLPFSFSSFLPPMNSCLKSSDQAIITLLVYFFFDLFLFANRHSQ